MILSDTKSAGVIGGSAHTVSLFLDQLAHMGDLVIDKTLANSYDMAVVNYVVWKYHNYSNVMNGVTLTSEFGKYQKRNDVVFLHK